MVIAGPFKGIKGIVTRLKGATRVVISLDSIVQAVSVEVAPEFLEHVGKDSKGIQENLFSRERRFSPITM